MRDNPMLDPDYGLPEPVAKCPCCGENLYCDDYIYKDIFGNIFGCESCVKRAFAEELEE